MNRLLQIIVAAIAVIAGYKKTISDLREQLAAANTDRDSLRAQVEKDAENDADLTRRAEQSEADKAAIEQQFSEANTKAEELAQQLNDEPSLPSVHTDTFEVTAPPSESLQDLAFRENQAENSGNLTPNPAPAVMSGPTGPNPVDEANAPKTPAPDQENK